MDPLLSVIMPVYNQEKYLAEAIESVLNQTLNSFEFIILDDGSTDRSADIMRDYALRDRRLIPFFRANTGKCRSTNFLVDQARTNYCAFLDADDVMLPQRLENQLAFHLQNPEVDATSCHCYYINEYGKSLGKQYYPGLVTINDCNTVRSENLIVQCSFTGLMTTKKSFLKLNGLDGAKYPCEDFDFFNRLIDKYNLIIIQDTLMKYRIHSAAVSVSRPLHMFDKTSWIYDCIASRRAGEPERTFDEFMELRKSEIFWKKLTRKQFQYSQLFFRKAGISMMSKKYIHFFCQFLLASILSPRYVMVKLTRLAKLS